MIGLPRGRLASTLGLLLVPVALAGSPAYADGTPVRVRGTVVSLDGTKLVVHAKDGEDVTVKLDDNFGALAVVKSSMADIKEGTFIGTATVTQPDSSLRSVEVVVFPDKMRGTGEGHYPWDLGSKSMMTNATVANAVKGVDGQTVTVTYKGGEKKIDIPANVPVVALVPADKADIKPGAIVFVPSDASSGRVPDQRCGAIRQGRRDPADVRSAALAQFRIPRRRYRSARYACCGAAASRCFAICLTCRRESLAGSAGRDLFLRQLKESPIVPTKASWQSIRIGARGRRRWVEPIIGSAMCRVLPLLRQKLPQHTRPRRTLPANCHPKDFAMVLVFLSPYYDPQSIYRRDGRVPGQHTRVRLHLRRRTRARRLGRQQRRRPRIRRGGFLDRRTPPLRPQQFPRRGRPQDRHRATARIHAMFAASRRTEFLWPVADRRAVPGEEAVMSAIYASLDNIPVVGGSAGDGLRFEKTWVFLRSSRSCAMSSSHRVIRCPPPSHWTHSNIVRRMGWRKLERVHRAGRPPGNPGGDVWHRRRPSHLRLSKSLHHRGY